MIEEKPVKLTKKGLPDKRRETSKLNISKAQNKVKEIVGKSKVKKQLEPVKEEETEDESSDSEEESDTEIIITKNKKKVAFQEPEHEPEIESSPPPPEPNPTEVFIEKEVKKRNKMDEDIFGKIDMLAKSVEELKTENTNLKKSFIRNDRMKTLSSLSQQMLCKF